MIAAVYFIAIIDSYAIAIARCEYVRWLAADGFTFSPRRWLTLTPPARFSPDTPTYAVHFFTAAATPLFGVRLQPDADIAERCRHEAFS